MALAPGISGAHPSEFFVPAPNLVHRRQALRIEQHLTGAHLALLFPPLGFGRLIGTSMVGCTLMRRIRGRLSVRSFGAPMRFLPLPAGLSVWGRLARHLIKIPAPLQKRDEDAHIVVRRC